MIFHNNNIIYHFIVLYLYKYIKYHIFLLVLENEKEEGEKKKNV